SARGFLGRAGGGAPRYSRPARVPRLTPRRARIVPGPRTCRAQTPAHGGQAGASRPWKAHQQGGRRLSTSDSVRTWAKPSREAVALTDAGPALLAVSARLQRPRVRDRREHGRAVGGECAGACVEGGTCGVDVVDE